MLLNNLRSLKNVKNVVHKVFPAKYFSETAKTVPRAASQTQTSDFPIAQGVPDVKKPTTVTQVKVSDGPTLKTINPSIVSPVILPDDRTTVSFDEIPGPASLRYISKFWGLVPVVGTQVTASAIQYMLGAGKFFGSQMSWIGGAWLFRRLLDEYGPIVRLHGPFGGDVVILSRPEDVSSLFQNEGPYPIRSCLDSIEQYRLKYRRFKQAGPFIMFGPEWEKLRKSVEKPLQVSIIKQGDQIEQTCDELLHRIVTIRNRQEEVPPGFQNEIYKWAMECLCSVTLSKRIGFLDPCGLSPTSDPGRLLDGFFGATAAVRKLEYGWHFYKFYETWAWKELVKNCDMIDSILSKCVQRAKESLQAKKTDAITLAQEVTFIEGLLLNTGIMADDVMTILLDMMLIGVNATTHTVSYLLYHLARTPRCQMKIYDEIKNKPLKLTEPLKNRPYLQACIRESLRLKPPMPILSRVLSKDVVIHNYRIPKNTYILIATHLSSSREEHFEDALKFKPERWLADDSSIINKEFQTFASIPFGHGPKACIAKELAEAQVAVLISKIIKRFRVEYHYGNFNSSFDKFLSPQKRPLKFRFIDRI